MDASAVLEYINSGGVVAVLVLIIVYLVREVSEYKRSNEKLYKELLENSTSFATLVTTINGTLEKVLENARRD